MPFPKADRVLYKKNPLKQVVCQLRFPPILRIDAEIPAEFQDSIRHHFPNLGEKAEWDLEIPQELKGQIPPELIRHALKPPANRNYEFSSEDGIWKVNLTRSFIALSTTRYERWEGFKRKLEIPLNALMNTYSPSYFTRVGLRYIDVIQPSELNLLGVSWNELLQPFVTGFLGSSEVGDRIENFEGSSVIGLSDGQSSVRILTKLVKEVKTDEKCFMIDSDFFNGNKMEIQQAEEKLNYFNVRSSRLIQWCVTERLHEAMEPTKL